jgi:hypothetical protein
MKWELNFRAAFWVKCEGRMESFLLGKKGVNKLSYYCGIINSSSTQYMRRFSLLYFSFKGGFRWGKSLGGVLFIFGFKRQITSKQTNSFPSNLSCRRRSRQ